MQHYQYIFGPVPSRRLGLSLGVSPIPDSTCNYSCIYCQLGRTTAMTNTTTSFFPVEDILAELDAYLSDPPPFDVISVVGEGEPTLYADLKPLLEGIRARTDKPVVVITNGALLSDPKVRQALCAADIVAPSIDAYNEDIFRKMHRPHGALQFNEVHAGLVQFAREFHGQLWGEIMLVEGVNNSREDIDRLADFIRDIPFDRIYINTPVRPPAEADCTVANQASIDYAVETLGGIAIDRLTTGAFYSGESDDYQAALDIIRRHPMNQFEIDAFLSARQVDDKAAILTRLQADPVIDVLDYKGYQTYRYVKQGGAR